MSLFHQDCGKMLERETETLEDGREVQIGYCRNCDEYADIEVEDGSMTVTSQQEDNGITESFENIDEGFLKDYSFKNCDHDKAIEHELSAGRGDEDNLIMYECSECGNTERETYTRF